MAYTGSVCINQISKKNDLCVIYLLFTSVEIKRKKTKDANLDLCVCGLHISVIGENKCRVYVNFGFVVEN